MPNIVRALGGGAGYTTVVLDNGTTTNVRGIRSVRNNNPGNIEYGKFARSMGAVGSDGRFAVFPTDAMGNHARETLFFSGGGYRDKLLSQAVARWAPESENNVAMYTRALLNSVGGVNKRMRDYSPQERANIMAAMRVVEGGKGGKVSYAPVKYATATTIDGGSIDGVGQLPDVPIKIPNIDAGNQSTQEAQDAVAGAGGVVTPLDAVMQFKDNLQPDPIQQPRTSAIPEANAFMPSFDPYNMRYEDIPMLKALRGVYA